MLNLIVQDKSEKLQVCAYVWSNPNDPNLYAEWDFEVSNHVIFLISICSSQNQYNSHCFKKNNELFYIFMMINLIMNCSVLKQQSLVKIIIVLSQPSLGLIKRDFILFCRYIHDWDDSFTEFPSNQD